MLPCVHASSLPHIVAAGRLHSLPAPSSLVVRIDVVFSTPRCHSRSSLSTPEFRSPSHGGNLNRSASLSCTERAPESGSVGGSVTQIPGTPFQYIPDFCVRALADLQFVKVTGVVDDWRLVEPIRSAAPLLSSPLRSLVLSTRTVSWRPSWTARRSPPRAAAPAWTRPCLCRP